MSRQPIREDSFFKSNTLMPERSILIVCTNQTVGAFIGRPLDEWFCFNIYVLM